MGISYNPSIVSSGLVLCLDAGNPKSYGDNTENLLSTSIRTADGNGATSGSGWTITANNAISPDGTTTATLLTQSSSLSNSGIVWLNGGNSTGQVMSIFCKPVSGSVVIQGQTGNGDGWNADLSTNVFTDTSGGRHANGKVDVYPNGWKRVIIPMLSISPFAGPGDFPGGDFYLTVQGIGSVLLWGWQRETGSTANPYYPTTGTAKTRGTTWTDLSGRGNTGTLTNGPTYSSANGGSIVFDGSNDYVDLTQTIQFNTGDFSISGWFRSNSGNTSYKQIWSSGYNGGTPDLEIGLLSGTNQLYLYIRPPGELITTTYAVDDNVWRHFTATKTSSTISLYVNGSLVSSVSGTYTSDVDDAGVIPRIGNGLNNINNRPFNGNIAQVSVYNRALTAAEVSQNFNALRSRFSL
jgi:hypothetical protein